MKIIAIGDPHIKSDNIIEFDIFNKKLHDLIDRELPDFIVVLGDVLHYHEKLYTQSLNRATTFLKDLGTKIKTFVLVGNHDMINNQQFLTDNHWMNGMKLWNNNVIVVDKTEKIKLYDKNIYLLPYVFPGRFVEALETKDKEWNNADIIFAHQEFKGCKMGAIISEVGDTWDEKSPMVVSGHIHSNQWIGKNVYYPGSAMQHAFGESDRNIIPVIEWEGNNIKIREEDLGLPRKKIVTTDIDKIDKLKIKETEDQIKLTINGTNEEFKQFKSTKKYKDLINSGIKVVFKQKELKKSTKVNSVDFDEILKELIISEKNSQLYSLYQKIVNNSDEIIIL